jgi:hypothetical protein
MGDRIQLTQDSAPCGRESLLSSEVLQTDESQLVEGTVGPPTVIGAPVGREPFALCRWQTHPNPPVEILEQAHLIAHGEKGPPATRQGRAWKRMRGLHGVSEVPLGHSTNDAITAGRNHRPVHSCLGRSVDAVASCAVWRRRDEGLGLPVGGHGTNLDGPPSVHAIRNLRQCFRPLRPPNALGPSSRTSTIKARGGLRPPRCWRSRALRAMRTGPKPRPHLRIPLDHSSVIFVLAGGRTRRVGRRADGTQRQLGEPSGIAKALDLGNGVLPVHVGVRGRPSVASLEG